MITATLTRIEYLEDRTLGRLDVEGETFATLELPWRNNRPNVSCIPNGFYNAALRWSSKYKEHVYIDHVPNRSMILIHNGNYPHQTKGCILVGERFADIDNDGKLEVVNSRAALAKLVDILRDRGAIGINIEDYELDGLDQFIHGGKHSVQR